MLKSGAQGKSRTGNFERLKYAKYIISDMEISVINCK